MHSVLLVDNPVHFCSIENSFALAEKGTVTLYRGWESVNGREKGPMQAFKIKSVL